MQGKSGLFYIVLSYKSAAGKRQTPWIATGLPVKGNKKCAEELLWQTREDFMPDIVLDEATPFTIHLERWLAIVKSTVALIRRTPYCKMTRSVIIPYFKPIKRAFRSLQARSIQAFYTK